MGWRLRDISPKMTYRWPTDIWKDVQHQKSSGNAGQNHMRYHLTPVRMAINNKSTNKKWWWGYEEKGTLMHCWWDCKLLQSLWKTVWSFLKKLKIEWPYDPAIPLLGIYLQKPNILIWKDICISMFTEALSIIAKTWKQPKCPLKD